MSFPKFTAASRVGPTLNQIADPVTGKFRTETTKEALMREGMTEQEAQQEVNAQLSRKYGGGMSAAELADFETLVGRLESSKMRQAAQTNQARQRDIYGGGLASIMGNF